MLPKLSSLVGDLSAVVCLFIWRCEHEEQHMESVTREQPALESRMRLFKADLFGSWKLAPPTILVRNGWLAQITSKTNCRFCVFACLTVHCMEGLLFKNIWQTCHDKCYTGEGHGIVIKEVDMLGGVKKSVCSKKTMWADSWRKSKSFLGQRKLCWHKEQCVRRAGGEELRKDQCDNNYRESGQKGNKVDRQRLVIHV